MNDTEAKTVHARDCKCRCGAQAVAFWPVIDPDIRAHAYCRACLDKAQTQVLTALCDGDKR